MIEINDAGKYIKTIQFMDTSIDLYTLSEEPSSICILGYYVPKGQVFLRNYINTNLRATYNPWCIVNAAQKQFLTIESILYWKIYSKFPKIIAFCNSKLIAIKMCSIFIDIITSRLLHNKDKLDINLKQSTSKFWLDMQNKPYNGIPIITKQTFGKFKLNTQYIIDEVTGKYFENKTMNYIKK